MSVYKELREISEILVKNKNYAYIAGFLLAQLDVVISNHVPKEQQSKLLDEMLSLVNKICKENGGFDNGSNHSVS